MLKYYLKRVRHEWHFNRSEVGGRTIPVRPVLSYIVLDIYVTNTSRPRESIKGHFYYTDKTSINSDLLNHTRKFYNKIKGDFSVFFNRIL